MQFGQVHNPAPELRVPQWIGADGKPLDRPLKLADLGEGWKIIFAFQHWCPGCHTRGFPTLKRLYEALGDKGVGFAVIQTVFEGQAQNTYDKLVLNQNHYKLPVPFGHDPLPEGENHPSFMEDYRSAGTPWFTLIEPGGQVVYADFRLDAERLLQAWNNETLSFSAA